MATLKLDVCYKCAGGTYNKMMNDTKGLVGGCAITICELCGNSISNTLYVYTKDIYVHDRGLITKFIEDNNRKQTILLENIKGPSDYVDGNAFSYKYALLKINQKLGFFGGKIEFISMNDVISIKNNKTIWINDALKDTVEGIILLIWAYNTTLENITLENNSHVRYLSQDEQPADEKTITDIQKILNQSVENHYVNEMKDLAELPFYKKLFK